MLRPKDSRGIVSSRDTIEALGHYRASVGQDRLGKTYAGKEELRKGVKALFERFPNGKFENPKVAVAGDVGSFEWDFVVTEPARQSVTNAGRDLLAFRGDPVVLKNAFRKSKSRRQTGLNSGC